MGYEMDLRYLNQREVAQLGGEDMTLAVADMERTLVLREEKDYILPDKVAMGFGKSVAEEKVKGRINAMPAYLGGEYAMAGVKWVSSNPANVNKGMPRGAAIIILNDPETKYPVAFMDGTAISAMRTGAIGGVAAKYLSREDSESMLIIGAGYQSRTQLEAVLVTRPNLRSIYVYDLVFERAAQMAKEMSEKLGRTITPVEDAKKIAPTVDILITVTGAFQPVVDADWLGRGCLYINVGGYECTYDTVRKADKLYVDNWEAVKHRQASAVARMAADGLITDADITADLGAVITGQKPGRTSNEEIIYFNPVGMGIEDVAIATRVYNKAVEQNVGTILEYWR